MPGVMLQVTDAEIYLVPSYELAQHNILWFVRYS